MVAATAAAPRPQRPGGGFTWRAFVLIAVVAFLALTYARSVTVFLDQQRAITEAQAQIEAHNAEISRLEDERLRWSDPDYVRTQARERLGWVLPGEVGYRVIAADGTLVGPQTGAITGEINTDEGLWYERLWTSLQAADQPLVVPGENGVPAPPEHVDLDSTEHE